MADTQAFVAESEIKERVGITVVFATGCRTKAGITLNGSWTWICRDVVAQQKYVNNEKLLGEV